MRRAHRVRREERGVVGGAEALAFGTLILFVGTLLVTHLWTIVETRVALDAAARDHLRAYTRQVDHHSADIAGDIAARSTLRARGTPLQDLRITPPDPTGFGPCGIATVTLVATVPASRLPFIGDLAGSEVRITHSELIDAHREVTAHDRFDLRSTPCGRP